MSYRETIQHSLIPTGNVHGMANWSVADITARNALAGLSATDLFKVCYVQSVGQFFALTSYFPVVWTPLGQTSRVEKQIVISPTSGAISLTNLDYSVVVVALNQNVTSITLGSITEPDTAQFQTVKFRQTGSGGYTVSGWPSIKWENGLLPVIDTSVGGVTSVALLYGYNEITLGTF